MINDFLIGICVAIGITLFLETSKQFNKKIIATLTLTGIAFIYVGFVWQNVAELIIVSVSVIFFIFLSYYGFTKNYKYIILGLILHGLWDLIFPHFSIFVSGPIGADFSKAFPISQGRPNFLLTPCRSLLVISNPTAKP